MNLRPTDLNMHVDKLMESITPETLSNMLKENPNLRGMFQGYISEVELKKQLLATPGVTNVVKIQDQDPEKGDLKVTYLGEEITIEVKSISTDSVKWDHLNDIWCGTVTLKSTDIREITIEGKGKLRCTHLERGQFDILAISCFAVYNEWEFHFMESDYLPSSKLSTDYLKTSFVVNPETTPCLVPTLPEILHSVYLKKQMLK